MDKILEALPEYILCITYGFIFIRIFRYICSLRNASDYQHIIWESLIVGFVLKKIYLVIPFSVSPEADIIGSMILTAVLSVIFSKIYSSAKVDKILRFLHIYRNRHVYIWQDIIDPKYATIIECSNPNTKEMYIGTLICCEDFTNQPYIILNNYEYWENYDDENTYHDHRGNLKMTALINTAEFTRIYPQYIDGSSKIKTIKD